MIYSRRQLFFKEVLRSSAIDQRVNSGALLPATETSSLSKNVPSRLPYQSQCCCGLRPGLELTNHLYRGSILMSRLLSHPDSRHETEICTPTIQVYSLWRIDRWRILHKAPSTQNISHLRLTGRKRLRQINYQFLAASGSARGLMECLTPQVLQVTIRIINV